MQPRLGGKGRAVDSFMGLTSCRIRVWVSGIRQHDCNDRRRQFGIVVREIRIRLIKNQQEEDDPKIATHDTLTDMPNCQTRVKGETFLVISN